MPTLENLFLQLENVKVIEDSISYSEYTTIDLSISNTDLSQIDMKNANDFENYIENILQKNNSKVAFGGYTEERNLYKSSLLFNDEEKEERNIHIGLDLWIEAGTSVLATLDGIVHSFNFNVGKGNYGPTIILKHSIENHLFYTLYGHLSVESIENIEIGNVVMKGQQIATLGDATVNGGYSPHLHFQIIKEIKDYLGDYPGVCSRNDLDYYLENCPDPNLLLKIKS
jgi:murein DD-endopeptidase MepM/ murein hydrolase activator NlpD